MNEKQIKGFGGLVATAKTIRELRKDVVDPCDTCKKSESYRNQYCQSCERYFFHLPRPKWVSVADVEKLQKLFEDWWNDYNYLLGDASGDSECKRRLRQLLVGGPGSQQP